MTIRGETGYINRGADQDYKKIMYSRIEQALVKEITISGGWGVLKAGTIMALNKSAAGNYYKYFPYQPATPDSSSTDQKSAFVVSTPSGTSVVVTMEDSYKFVVGDDLILDDSGTSPENLGAITAIDRTTYKHIATITVTETISGTFTVSEDACVYPEGGAATPWSDAVGILLATVDTGTGEDAKGANAPMLVSNAIVYKNLLTNYDSAAGTDLSATADGQLLIIK